VISPGFAGDRIEDHLVAAKKRSIDQGIEPTPFRPEGLVPNDPFVREIVETGIEV